MSDWPVKKRDITNAHLDSAIWDSFLFRDDDVVIANWAKSGCTWLQQIVAQLVFQEEQVVPLASVSPWVEFAYQPQKALFAALEAQSHRRFVKTHLPVDALVFSPRAKYLYIARDGRDVAWSLFNHLRGLNDTWYRVMRKVRGMYGPVPDGPPTDFREFFHRWLDDDGYPFWPFWSHVGSWWEVRDLPNVFLVHFSDLKRDLPGTMRRIAEFLGISVATEQWPELVARCRFSYMKRNASKLIHDGDLVFSGGSQTFFNSGENLGWRRVLDEEDVGEYLEAQRSRLPTECAHWLGTGNVELCQHAGRGLA